MKIPTDKFQKEIDYCASVYIAKALLTTGLITQKEYKFINNSLVKNYAPDFKFAGTLPDNFQHENR